MDVAQRVGIESVDELRALLGEVKARAATKERVVLHPRDRDWLAASPFCVISTSAADGTCDASPKGDPPGFTLVLDDTRSRSRNAPATAAPTGT